VRIVLDTSVLVAGLRSGAGASRRVILSCLKRRHDPLMGVALWHEYQDVLGRPGVWRGSGTRARQRQIVVDALASVAIWIQIWFVWRPNLRDEGDNHVLELAFNGNAAALVTMNTKDFRGGGVTVQGLDILTPGRFANKYPL
jgi:putative PIN family toxin of toxin-antitoxin system